MTSNRVDQTIEPGVLQQHERRIRVLEATPAGGGCCITPPQFYSYCLIDDSDGGGYDLYAAGAVIGGWVHGFHVGFGLVPGCAWLQGGLTGSTPQCLTGNLDAVVVDASKFNAGAKLGVVPSWSSDGGVGPYLQVTQKIGTGQIQQVATGLLYDFDVILTDHFYAYFYMAAGFSGSAGSPITIGEGAVTSTNPITLAENDIITAYWTTFTVGWD